MSQAGLEYSWKLSDGDSGSEACRRRDVLIYLWPLCLVEDGGGALHSLFLSFQKVMSPPTPLIERPVHSRLPWGVWTEVEGGEAGRAGSSGPAYHLPSAPSG